MMTGYQGNATGNLPCKVIAHRGYSSIYPENTLSSVQAALLETQAAGVEIDLHLTSDHRLILQHDEDLQRMTDGTGKIEDRPWQGYIDGLKTKGTNEPVVLLSQILDFLQEHAATRPQPIHLVLDVKDDQKLKVLDELKLLLAEYPAIYESIRIYLGVWNQEFASHARSLFPKPSPSPQPLLTLIAETCPPGLIHSHLYDAFNLDVDRVDRDIVEEARKAGKDVLLWTCNTASQITKAKELAVQGILTDDPLAV